jgi:hypothetical protein
LNASVRLSKQAHLLKHFGRTFVILETTDAVALFQEIADLEAMKSLMTDAKEFYVVELQRIEDRLAQLRVEVR